jgi:hypothetical protein
MKLQDLDDSAPPLADAALLDVVQRRGRRLRTRRMLARAAALVVIGIGVVAGGVVLAHPNHRDGVVAVEPTTTSRPTNRHTSDLGPCPDANPAVIGQHFSLSALNSGVLGLDTKLVPFDALRVRVCSYGWRGGGELSGSAVLKSGVAAQFVTSTNRLQTRAHPPRRLVCHELDTSLLTFTTATKRMDVAVEDCGSGQASNGSLTVNLTQTWRNELQRDTTGSTATSRHTTGIVQGTIRVVAGVAIDRQVPGTVTATKASGQRWRATTTSTGLFSLTLPAGTYRFTGTSPARLNNAPQQCLAPTPVVVVGGETTQVEVVCDIG